MALDRLIVERKDSPVYPKAAEMGSFYGQWINGITPYFIPSSYDRNLDRNLMRIPFENGFSLVALYLKNPKECGRECIFRGFNAEGILELEVRDI